MVKAAAATLCASRPGALARLMRSVCPACGSRRVVRSRRRSALDHFLAVVGQRPFRCLGCLRRFHAWPGLRLLA